MRLHVAGLDEFVKVVVIDLAVVRKLSSSLR